MVFESCYYSPTMQKYELLMLLPLTGTESELLAAASKIEERVRLSGGTVASSTAIHKGKLAYPVKKNRQGYYHLVQFEMEPAQVHEFKKQLLLAQDTLRFTITCKTKEFTPFVPSAPRIPQSLRARTAYKSGETAFQGSIAPARPKLTTAAVRENVSIKEDGTPKVSMEEIDKKLEEILGE